MAARKITFVVAGSETGAAGATRGAAATDPEGTQTRLGTLKHSIQVSTSRAAAEKVSVTATPGRDLVVLQIANGPELVLHPESARDLMLAQQGVKRSRGARGRDEAAPDEVEVSANLRWSGLEAAARSRGAFGDVLLSHLRIFEGPAADLAADKIVERVDAQVDPGVYALPRSALPESLKGYPGKLSRIPAAANNAPILVLLHGTFSNTVGTFSKLWSSHPALVGALFDHYGDRVYALDHPTLGASPIANALALVNALPNGANLHLLTHSRGGLVAETLARVCGKPQLAPGDLAAFAGDTYAQHLADLKELARLVERKAIRVTRLVRVGCPARGTLLASKRLDAYLSVFKWALTLGGVPILPALVDFLALVAQRRADPEKIPGLEAQIPDGAFVQWIHSVDAPIPGELRVVAGDLEGDSLASWLKTLMADSFYWTDNDLVVQTRSMYGGTPREAGATFVLDQGGGVSHFRYFENARTANAIVDALRTPEPAGFEIIGPLSWAGKSSTGVRARRGDGVSPHEKPALFLLPGIVGSNLKVDGERIWIGWRLVNGLKRLELRAGDGVEPDGPVGTTYADIVDHFSSTHEVIEFAYDWRKPIEVEARRLADAVDAALDARETNGKPVRLLAHSMGGLVARTMHLERPATWKRLMAANGARLLMLGTPNAGSWAPMQVLSGDDSLGNVLALVGAPFRDHVARRQMSRYPGLIQMQADLLTRPELASEKGWQKIADLDLAAVREHNWWHRERVQLDEYEWGVPPQDVLDQAIALRQRLDQQAAGDFDGAVGKMLLVVGESDFTPDSYEWSPEGLVYLGSEQKGDGRVTLDRALLPGVRTWKFDCVHGSLPARKRAFEAYAELLVDGTTSKLPQVSGARGAAPAVGARVRLRPSRVPKSQRPPQTPDEVVAGFEAAAAPRVTAAGGTLRVKVVHGDLTFVRQPLMLGHYRSTQLAGAERVIDRLLNGAMTKRLRLDRYAHDPGESMLIPNLNADPDSPARIPRPEAVIVVGLGAEGGLRAAELVESAYKGAMAACEEEERKRDGKSSFELAATLIGSGGVGISPGQAAQLVAEGVRRANVKRTEQDQAPVVDTLVLIELYLDRAAEALQALRAQAEAEPAHWGVVATIEPGTGGLRRPLDGGYRGADYDFITATSEDDALGDPVITYTVDSKRARTEVRGQETQGRLIKTLIKKASNQPERGEFGKVLFRLLVPLELEPFLGGSTALQMELDRETARIPWELLDTGSGDDQKPWAIRSKLTRKLRTEQFREQVDDALIDAGVLIVGEPACEGYARLPGARDEAKAVKAALTGDGGFDPAQVHMLTSDDDGGLGPDAATVVNAFSSDNWRIVHIAGHGEPPVKKDGKWNPRGVVLSEGIFLGPKEIKGKRTVPELVFVNTCYGAAWEAEPAAGKKRDTRKPYNRPKFAANVAEELIRQGVRCVIAAGWAVDDTAARVFAQTFYASIMRGARFSDAVGEAREAARQKHEGTWAAYQCYGDPDWYLRRGDGQRERKATPPGFEFAGVTSPLALELALSTIATRLEFQKASAEEQAGKIAYLEEAYGRTWAKIGFVCEAFGKAWAAAGKFGEAIGWYRLAVGAEDGSAPLKAAEQLANLLARTAPDLTQAKGRARIKEAIAMVERLSALEPTVERESILGSAYKRLSFIDRAARKSPAKAIAQMKKHYARAEEIARRDQAPNLFYPALNRIAAEVIVEGGKRRWKGLDAEGLAAVGDSLASAPVDFFTVAGAIELRIYVAVAKRKLAAALPAIKSDFKDLKARVRSKTKWDSVMVQARFVLEPYAARASAAERAAAERLIADLEELAGQE